MKNINENGDEKRGGRERFFKPSNFFKFNSLKINVLVIY
jgi:hypothetical protein